METSESSQSLSTLGDSFLSTENDQHEDVTTIPNVFKNLPTLSTNRRDNLPSINAVADQQQTTNTPTSNKLATLSSKSKDANAQVSELTLDALKIQYNTIIRQETTSITTPTLDGSNHDELIQTSTATKVKPEEASTTTSTTSIQVTNTTTISSSILPLTSSTTTLTSPTTFEPSSSSPNPTQSLVLNSIFQNSSLTLVSTTTARQITDSTESGDLLVSQTDGQEIKGEVKQISRAQKIDDNTAAQSGTTPASGSILSDHLVSAVQAGITNQVAGNEGIEH